MKKLITLTILTTLLFALKPQTASADCTALYGGGESCPPSFSFDIQKSVQRPGKAGDFVIGGFSFTDPKYSPSQNVSFEITVKNTGSQTIPAITVVDTLPQSFISFVSGKGSFDANTKKLTYTISNLEAGKTDKNTVTGKIADSNLLPSDEGIICLVNNVEGTDSNGLKDSAQGQFCVQKQVLGGSTPQVLPGTTITQTPATGPEMLALFSLIPTGLIGTLLLRKTGVKSRDEK